MGLATPRPRGDCRVSNECSDLVACDPRLPHARIEAELTQTIVVAKAWDDAVRDRKTLAKDDGNS